MSSIRKSNLSKYAEFAPLDTIFYPETDFKPMAETDKHRDLILGTIAALQNHFAAEPEIYVTGNILVYYTEGVIEDCVSPDTMIVKNVPNHARRSYFVWEEQLPTVIFEMASRSTWKTDRVDKRLLYEMLGVQEYFVFNPEYPKRNPALLAFRMSEKKLLEPVAVENNRVFSEQLGLELVDNGETLRIYDPKTKKFLSTLQETTVELKKVSTDLKKVTTDLKKVSTEKETLQSDLNKVSTEKETLQSDLKKVATEREALQSNLQKVSTERDEMAQRIAELEALLRQTS